MMRFGSMPESFQISVATTSHGFEMVIHTPSNPASAIGLMNVFAVSEADLACGVDDDVAFGEPRIVGAAVDERHVVRAEGERIAQILHFGGEFGAVVIVSRALLRHIQFVANALQHEAVRHMRPHMPHADDADFRNSAHGVPP